MASVAVDLRCIRPEPVWCAHAVRSKPGWRAKGVTFNKSTRPLELE